MVPFAAAIDYCLERTGKWRKKVKLKVTIGSAVGLTGAVSLVWALTDTTNSADHDLLGSPEGEAFFWGQVRPGNIDIMYPNGGPIFSAR